MCSRTLGCIFFWVQRGSSNGRWRAVLALQLPLVSHAVKRHATSMRPCSREPRQRDEHSEYSVHTLTTRANSRQEGHIGPLVSRITLSHPTLSSPACSYMQNRDRATANAIARASAALALLVESMPNFMSAIGSTAPAGAGQRLCRSGVEDGQGEGDQCRIAPRLLVLTQGSERDITLSAALPWPPATAMLSKAR